MSRTAGLRGSRPASAATDAAMWSCTSATAPRLAGRVTGINRMPPTPPRNPAALDIATCRRTRRSARSLTVPGSSRKPAANCSGVPRPGRPAIARGYRRSWRNRRMLGGWHCGWTAGRRPLFRTRPCRPARPRRPAPTRAPLPRRYSGGARSANDVGGQGTSTSVLRLPSSVLRPPLIVHRPPSTVHRPPSPAPVRRPPPTVHRPGPPSTVYPPTSNVHRPPSTVDRPPSTVHRLPSTLQRPPSHREEPG